MRIRIRMVKVADLTGKDPVLVMGVPPGPVWGDVKDPLSDNMPAVAYRPAILETPVYSSYREDEILYWEPVEIVYES